MFWTLLLLSNLPFTSCEQICFKLKKLGIIFTLLYFDKLLKEKCLPNCQRENELCYLTIKNVSEICFHFPFLLQHCRRCAKNICVNSISRIFQQKSLFYFSKTFDLTRGLKVSSFQILFNTRDAISLKSFNSKENKVSRWRILSRFYSFRLRIVISFMFIECVLNGSMNFIKILAIVFIISKL